MKRFQYTKQPHNSHGFLLSICVFFAILLLFVQEINSLSDSTVKRQKEALENAITRSITYCYAVEGSYPESLDYLKEHYGLVYDEDLFYVDYRASGSNLLPDVTIIEKED